MNLTDLQGRIQVLYDNDTTVLDASDEDYKTRLALINAGIDFWEREEQWRELLVPSSAVTPITTVAEQSAYALPADFKEISGYVRLSDGKTSSYYPQKTPNHIQLYDNNSAERFFYITGNPKTGFFVNIHPAPTAGLTLTFEYYKKAAALATGSDIPEMSDPMFLVYFTLSKLFDADGAGVKAQKAYLEMTSRLEGMVQKNNLQGWFQNDEIEDVDFTKGVRGFGY